MRLGPAGQAAANVAPPVSSPPNRRLRLRPWLQLRMRVLRQTPQVRLRRSRSGTRRKTAGAAKAKERKKTTNAAAAAAAWPRTRYLQATRWQREANLESLQLVPLVLLLLLLLPLLLLLLLLLLQLMITPLLLLGCR